MLNNICLSKEHCYECQFEGNVYSLGSVLTNRRRCIFGITPDEWNVCTTFQDNIKLRTNVFTDLMNRWLFKKNCNLPTCNLCYHYRHPIGSSGPTCDDIIGSIRNLHSKMRFVVYENKPKF